MIIHHLAGFFRKYFSLKDVLFIFALLALFFVTRLINLEKFPIFNDEGIYIQWAKTAWHDASWRFISLTDGKQPLQTWGTIPFLKLFPNDALFAGRLFAVSMGLISLSGLFTLLFYFFNKRTAYIGSLLYIGAPFFLFYDRLALVDSGVNAAFIWILFFSVLLARTIRLDVALLFGLTGGIFLLTKSSVKVFFGLAALGPILFSLKNRLKFFTTSLNFYFLYAVAGIIAFTIYNVQRLSPFFHFVSEKNKTFILSFDDFLKNPFGLFFHNSYTLPLYVFWEMGFVLGVVGLLGFFFLYRADKKLFFYLGTYLCILYIGVSFFNIILYPRYLIFFPSLLLITASILLSIAKKHIVIPVSILLILSFFLFDYPIIFDNKSIPFPQVDRGQYLESWTAGWGIKDIVEYVREKSKEKPVVIVAEGDFGMSGDVLNVFVRKNDRIFIKGYWPLTKKDLASNQKELTNNQVFIVISHQDSLPTNWPMKLIKKYDKPGGKSTIYLLELTKE